jgi:hypothetical protein
MRGESNGRFVRWSPLESLEGRSSDHQWAMWLGWGNMTILPGDKAPSAMRLAGRMTEVPWFIPFSWQVLLTSAQMPTHASMTLFRQYVSYQNRPIPYASLLPPQGTEPDILLFIPLWVMLINLPPPPNPTSPFEWFFNLLHFARVILKRYFFLKKKTSPVPIIKLKKEKKKTSKENYAFREIQRICIKYNEVKGYLWQLWSKYGINICWI